MGLVDEVIEAIVALFIMIVFFVYVFPELAKVTGINVFYTLCEEGAIRQVNEANVFLINLKRRREKDD